ncbi:MAG: serine/threonine protein kinase [Planctomycetaceae bacterium]|nr:serine/threonine protein kinase [Planctomycetaceae bacterium]
MRKDGLMALKLTAESFLTGIRQSNLVPAKRLDDVMRQVEKSGIDTTDSSSIADEFVRREVITRWQADKLLQGKFKGFILGRYRLMELLGRGEMSSIYKAEHVRMKRRCAIKVLPASKVKDTSYLGRFHREAEAVAALDHPNIVRAYDVDMEVEAATDIHFLVMEYVEGADLERLHEKQGEFSIVQAVEYIRQAAEGLSHAHENGLIHRDIKPGNLLVDKKGTVKLLDLGLARFFNQTEEESLTIKHDEKVLGTADYLAPEQAVDSHAVDERADIYSLGCTLYFALVGHPPFTDGTLVQRLLAHQTKSPPPIQKQRAEVSDDLAAIVNRMMAKRKEDRFQKARDVADKLGQWLIENGGNEWRSAHPEVVGRLIGIEAVSQSAPSTPAEPKSSKPAQPAAPVAAAPKATTNVPRRRKERPENRVVQRPNQPLQPTGRSSAAIPIVKLADPAKVPTRISPASFRTAPKQPETLAEFLQYHQSWVIAGLVLVGVLMVAGVGLTLQAKTAPTPAPAEAPNPPRGTYDLSDSTIQAD